MSDFIKEMVDCTAAGLWQAYLATSLVNRSNGLKSFV